MIENCVMLFLGTSNNGVSHIFLISGYNSFASQFVAKHLIALSHPPRSSPLTGRQSHQRRAQNAESIDAQWQRLLAGCLNRWHGVAHLAQRRHPRHAEGSHCRLCPRLWCKWCRRWRRLGQRQRWQHRWYSWTHQRTQPSAVSFRQQTRKESSKNHNKKTKNKNWI